ncbi:DEAD/DEAH box helicase [Aeromicrobium wangtongii]|uniref:DEAD/DEAH box helicase family protein n=1 Tax=Aeromicrobium wangtongii TaxID=2969247 RepID=A0ABY5M5C6_9ACTN|nr:DEAD/DEAH box helicase family protein [Aeromicrobium wangtongii]MCD9198329.1 DEAD/DEAH box helicase family protein [Aeromicrobium wangtongii]UUP12361.1 DEAD/DEAH box helicase family protein [Aeromicrobium wangtongii]
MKFTLKPYQQTALEDMLTALDQATTINRRDAKPTSVSLSATTGAGKTVIASAVIESLFYGNDDYEFEPDDGAVVVWFSDDPNLNEQTRFRIMEASDKVMSTDLVTIEPPFAKPRLEPGKVYFLNTQKLSKSSLLTRGHEVVDEADVLEGTHASVQPDLQGYTIWQTIANTIEDPDLSLYLIVDEAHRGFGTKQTRDKSTIVQRLVNGHSGYPPVPVVWGISATIGDFTQAMDEAAVSGDRRYLPAVKVDGFQVQESGLVKDIVKVDIPAEAQAIDMVLVRRAAAKLKHSTERWQSYCESQALPDVVKPLLVLQAPNTPDHDKIGEALNVIFEVMPELSSNAVRHVLGEHSLQTFGSHQVDWIEPQVVQDRSHVRILIAKDAISTGWDCPRAEVLLSFRPAKDHDHIQQLLGRMVRTPLARRVPGDDELNSVDCLLPFFDRATAGSVVKLLTAQIDGVPDSSGRKVIEEECVMTPNKTLPESVWKVWDDLPTMTIPQRGTSPVKRLTSLALALSTDLVREEALAEVAMRMHRVLDESAAQYKTRVKAATAEVLAVRLQQLSAKFGASGLEYTDIVEQADDRAIRFAFEDAKKAFGSDIANAYVDHLTAGDDGDEALREAYVRTAALSYVPEVREAVDKKADQIVQDLFDEHAEAIEALPDDRRQEYRDINALAATPQVDRLGRPRTRIEDYVETDESGQTTRAELVKLHLMSDENGDAPVTKLNDWEVEVVKHEIGRDGSIAWYRNPPRQTADSLGIAYRDEATGNWRSMHPDFVFFHEVAGEVKASIVDPHGHHLDDSLVKLQALAAFAEDHGDAFHRIEALSKVGNVMKVLNMKDDDVRGALKVGGQTVDWFYNSQFAANYFAEEAV